MSKKSKKQMDIDDYLLAEDEVMDVDTGEVAKIAKEVLNKVIVVETRRKDGSLRIQQDFSNCPTLAEQHTAHLTNLNYLIEKYKPDELAAYIAARNEGRPEILGHDFSREPSLADAKNIVYRSQQEYEALPEEIKQNFRNHVEFLKFIDNPANAEKMVRLGLLKEKQIQNLQSLEPVEAAAVSGSDAGKKSEEKEGKAP